MRTWHCPRSSSSNVTVAEMPHSSYHAAAAAVDINVDHMIKYLTLHCLIDLVDCLLKKTGYCYWCQNWIDRNPKIRTKANKIMMFLHFTRANTLKLKSRKAIFIHIHILGGKTKTPSKSQWTGVFAHFTLGCDQPWDIFWWIVANRRPAAYMRYKMYTIQVNIESAW